MTLRGLTPSSGGSSTRPHRRDQAPVAAPVPAGESVADELRKLADLRSEGILSDQEFADLKAELLS
jgi:hypothetical protein